MDTDRHAAAVDEEVTLSAGTLLRQAREAKNISLEAAAEATKIGRNYLRALEDDRYQDLPAAAYLSGFVRMYATYLGLPADELVMRAASLHAAAQPESSTAPEPVTRRQWSFRWQRFILPLILLGALAISTLLIPTTPPQRPNRPIAPQAVQAPLSTVAAVTAVQPVVSSSRRPPVIPVEAGQPTPSAKTPPEPLTATPKLQSGFMVSMKVKRNSSLTVTIDDAATQGYELTSGDLIEWKATRTIAFDLSDGGGVEIALNGVPLKLQEAAGKQAYIVLDANGIRR